MNLKYGETMWIRFIWRNMGGRWQAAVNTIMNLRILDYVTTGASKNTLLLVYGVRPGYVKLT
jgi:F420-0:gamma-glutamyl ligase-like protein